MVTNAEKIHNTEQKFCSLAEAARILGVSVGTARRYCKNGYLKHKKLKNGTRDGVRYRVLIASIDSFGEGEE